MPTRSQRVGCTSLGVGRLDLCPLCGATGSSHDDERRAHLRGCTDPEIHAAYAKQLEDLEAKAEFAGQRAEQQEDVRSAAACKLPGGSACRTVWYAHA